MIYSECISETEAHHCAMRKPYRLLQRISPTAGRWKGCALCVGCPAI